MTPLIDENLAFLFEKSALQDPDKIAIIDDHKSMTYKELNTISNKLAAVLVQGGYEKKNIGISISRSAEVVVSIIAILKAGSAYVFLDPAYPKNRISYILQHSEINLLITNDQIKGSFEHVNVPLLVVDKIDFSTKPADLEKVKIHRDQRAYIMYTSGSTGRPKGVEVMHCNIISYLEAIKPLFQFNPKDVYLETASFSFSSSVRQYLLPLLNGMTVVIAGDSVTKSLPLLLRLIKDRGISVIDTTQSLWKYGISQIERLEKNELEELLQANLRLIVFSGDMLPARLVQKIRQVYPLPPKIINIYGQTETIGSFAFPIPDDFSQDQGIVPIGYPLRNTQIFILDERLKPVNNNEPGEVCISSPSVARGYFKDPVLTKKTFLDPNLFNEAENKIMRSGDIIRYYKDRPAEIIGRKDFQVKIRGIRIDINEIENVLLSYPGIGESVVVAFRDHYDEPRLTGFVVSEEGRTFSEESVKNFLKEYLPEIFIPERIIVVKEIPVTPNRKTDRIALQKAAKEGLLEHHYTKIEFNNETEKTLYNLFARLLNVKNFKKDESFFDLGGHSLLVVELVEIMSKIFNKHIPIDLVYRSSSVNKLAASVEQIDNLKESYNLVAIQPEGNFLPFICVHADDANFHLPKYLGNDIPFFGFFHQGRNGEPIRFTEIEIIAERYMMELLKLKPQGPYVIGGYSIGGVIAAELARMLQAINHEIKLLILIDSESPDFKGRRIKGSQIKLDRDSHKEISGSAFQRSSGKLIVKVIHTIKYRLIRVGYYIARLFVLFKKKVPLFLRNSYIIGVYRRARAHYHPGKININTILVKASIDNFEDQDLGWNRFIEGTLNVYTISANHDNIIKEPQVMELAEIIHQAIKGLSAQE